MRVMKTFNCNILYTHRFLKHLNIVKTQILFLPTFKFDNRSIHSIIKC